MSWFMVIGLAAPQQAETRFVEPGRRTDVLTIDTFEPHLLRSRSPKRLLFKDLLKIAPVSLRFET
ncbi:MAG: hypothetical protein ACU85E_07765 [Gammaproteobacteria bacterium]